MRVGQPPFKVASWCNPRYELISIVPLAPLNTHTLLQHPAYLDLSQHVWPWTWRRPFPPWPATPPTKAQNRTPQCVPWHPPHSSNGKCEHKHPGVIEAMRAAPAVCFFWLKPKYSQLTHGSKIRGEVCQGWRRRKEKKVGQRKRLPKVP